MKSEKAIIVAYADNRVIGAGGAIPWLGRMPADMRRVRELTTDQAIIMGSETFRSIGRALPQRQNIVLSRAGSAFSDALTARSLDEAFALVEPDRAAFIFGGANVYAQSLDLVEVIYATEIHGQFDGDALFPTLDERKWRETDRQDFPADHENAYSYSFVKYERRKNG